jgi:hypothetical protein
MMISKSSVIDTEISSPLEDQHKCHGIEVAFNAVA